MINATSRYADSQVLKVADENGDLQLAIVPGMQSNFTVNFTYYQWVWGDRIDALANQWFGDATRWWSIADANPEILDWTEIEPGVVLRIPSA